MQRFTVRSRLLTCVLVVVFAQQCLSQASSASKLQPASSPARNNSRPPAPESAETAWRVLRLGLQDLKSNQRMQAVKALSLLSGNRRAFTFALRALNDKDSRVRAAAAATLGDLRNPGAIPALKAALTDKDISVMLAATHALYVLKDPIAYEVYYAILMGDRKTSAGLIQAQLDRLKDPKQVVEMGFQEGLGFVPYAGMGVEAYKALMKHNNAPVRAAVARYLAADPDPVTEDALVQTALADKDSIVREAALDALAQRGDPRCIEQLSRNLDEKIYAVRYRTAATIIRLSAKKAPAK
ncbi:MAG TPA: HEAT repeat domain-containing protein [Terriglobales bacterium]|nr:HEAT repeat domain-containing protein [Terriglobales bacterium]